MSMYVYSPRQIPTILNLHATLKEDIRDHDNHSLLRCTWLNLDFKWKKTNSNRTVQMEIRCCLSETAFLYEKEETERC